MAIASDVMAGMLSQTSASMSARNINPFTAPRPRATRSTSEPGSPNNCVYDGIGVTIKPMGAVMQEGARGRRWRYLPFSDARFRRRNFLYSLPAERLTTAAAMVTGQLKETARDLAESQTWPGFESIAPAPQWEAVTAKA